MSIAKKILVALSFALCIPVSCIATLFLSIVVMYIENFFLSMITDIDVIPTMISALYLLIMAYCFFKRKYMKATFFLVIFIGSLLSWGVLKTMSGL